MDQSFLTEEFIKQLRKHLLEEERNSASIEKYTRKLSVLLALKGKAK